MTPTERAERAKQILEDPLFNSVLKEVREAFVTRLETAQIDQKGAFNAALALQTLRAIRGLLQSYVDEMAVVKHRASQDDFASRMKQRLRTMKFSP